MPTSRPSSPPPAPDGARAKRPARTSLDGPQAPPKRTRRTSRSTPTSPESLEEPPPSRPSSLLESNEPYIPHQTDPTHEVQPLAVAWEAGLLDYCQLFNRPLEAAPDVQRISALTKRYRLGGAYIHAFGIGHLTNVLNLGSDPNLRGNPRDLNSSHVDNLLSVFSTPGCMRDHESPITLMLNPDLLDGKLLNAVKRANPRDPVDDMPLLVLEHAHTKEIMELEGQLLSQVKDQRWMTDEQLRTTRQRLTLLRAQSPLATLLNGHHRIQALLRLGQLILDDHLQLLHHVRTQTVSQEEMRAEMVEIQRRAKMTVYRVELFDSAMPAELLNALVRNDDPRPQMGMGPGEKAWWTASRWDALMHNAAQDGAKTRAEQADKAFAVWSTDIGGPSAAVSSIASQTPSGAGTTPGRVGAHRKGEWAGGDPVLRLFTNPCTMEMVMNTRSALPVYNSILTQSLSVAMVQATGALLVTRFWLSCRTLLDIFDVAKGTGLENAEAYIITVPELPAPGYPEAVAHWNSLHSHPQNTPQYIPFYDPPLQAQFDDLYQPILDDQDLTIDIDWDNDDVIIKVRHVFESLGAQLQARHSEWSRRVGIAMRLHARLPITCEGPFAHGPMFSGASALPTKRWIERLANERSHFGLRQHGLVVLEFMIHKYLPIWTLGAQTVGTSINTNNWYGRSRGLHQVLMAITKSSTFGSMELRLDYAVSFLADPHLRIALNTVDEYLGDRFRTLMRQYCVLRVHGVDYPFLAAKPAPFLEHHHGLANLHSQLALARSVLKSLLFAPQRPVAAQFDELLRTHPVL